MIGQFFILSPRGDTIIRRDFRGQEDSEISRVTCKESPEVFFRKVKFWKGDAGCSPVFNIDKLNYIFLKRSGIYYVLTTAYNVPPTFCVDLLQRMTKCFKDFLGVLSEEALRKNFVLIYELIDEMIDFGYPQLVSTEQLKTCVHNEAIVVEQQHHGIAQAVAGSASTLGRMAASTTGIGLGSLGNLTPKTLPSHAIHRPIGLTSGSGGGKEKKNEIFVDILERLTVVLNSSGYSVHSSVDGAIQMKSYLQGNPELKLALNEDVVIGQSQSGSFTATGALYLDDCNFHEVVDLSDFDSQRLLSFSPPEGEFVVMNYRITSDFRLPFRIIPRVEMPSPQKLECVIKIRAEVPESNYGNNITVTCPMPKSTSFVSTELYPPTLQQTAEFSAKDKKVVWHIKKLQGGAETTIRCKIQLGQSALETVKREIGPISLDFEIPMYSVSNLQVRYLRISDKHGPSNPPYRWVRYVTQACSYICRVNN